MMAISPGAARIMLSRMIEGIDKNGCIDSHAADIRRAVAAGGIEEALRRLSDFDGDVEILRHRSREIRKVLESMLVAVPQT